MVMVVASDRKTNARGSMKIFPFTTSLPKTGWNSSASKPCAVPFKHCHLNHHPLNRQMKTKILLEATVKLTQNYLCQGPWNVDLRTPPGPEGSNGSLLRICRGHPDTLSFTICDFGFTIANAVANNAEIVNRKS